ncbi:MAG TPA: carboxy terminal-processing peptidase [Candidatus Binatia bacterium]|nr:carboxy terminal-processing peptidase [Candidatus Binatia bacterium]
MIKCYAVRILLLVLSGNLVLSFSLTPLLARQATADKTESSEIAEKSTKTFQPLNPGPADGQIAFLTARILEKYQYLQQPFNATVSRKFLDRYLETLDPMHVHFTQADLADFERYRTNLNRMTITPTNAADTHPGFEIFNRFVERLKQRVDYVDELLKTEKFTFDSDERILLNRKDQPYPKDLAEAKKLWRDRLRFEYLQEELGKLDAKKKSAGVTVGNERIEVQGTVQPGLTPTLDGAIEQSATNSFVSAGTNSNLQPGSSETTVEPKPKKTEAEEIVETLTHRYHRNLHTFIDFDSDDVLQIYLTALAHAYDPHSDYLGKASLDSFAISMNLSLFGIGAELMSEDGFCTINKLLPGGPAIKSKKIKEKDRIVAVAQSNQPPVDIIDMSLNKAVSLIRGPKGTEVRLTVVPAGEDSATRKQVTLIRDEISLPDSAAKAKIIELPVTRGANLRLGVIDLPSFYAPFDPSNSRGTNGLKSSTSEDVAKLLAKLKQENVRGVILDLRHNGGGSLEEAIKLTGLFIKEGPVVQVRGFDGSIQEDRDNDPSIAYDGPLIVLTSRFSASASEIVAGALQDYGRALIVGDASTHGKGTVQSVQALHDFLRFNGRSLTNDPGALKFTIKKFYRASGASTQKKGVVPDIVLPSILNDSKEFGESTLDNALEWDEIPSAKYERVGMVEPYLPELRKRSALRVVSDKDFQYIQEDIEWYKKQQADKTVSLNEKERLKEKHELDAKAKARDKERLARKDPQEKVYELSLKQALEPGLPAPMTKTNSGLTKLDAHQGPVPAAVGTNLAAAAQYPAPGAVIEDNPDEDKPPLPDADLNEAEHILVDYLSLIPKNNVAAVHVHPE